MAMGWFNNLKIRNKLVLFVVVMLLALSISGFVGIRGFLQWADNMQNVGDVRLPGVQALAHLNTERMSIRAQTVSVFQYDGNYNAQKALQDIMTERTKSWTVIDANWDAFAKLPRQTQRGIEAYARLQNEYKAWRDIYVDLDRLIGQLSQTTSNSEYDRLMRDYRETAARMVPISNQMGATFDAITTNNVASTQAAATAAVKLAQDSKWILGITMAVALLVAILMGFLMVRAISRPLNQMVGVLSNIDRSGDYSLKLNYASEDEVGQAATALNNMMANLQKALNNTNQVVGALAKGDFTQRIQGQYAGDLNRLQQGVNGSADSIATTMNELSKVMDALSAGEFGIKINAQLAGDYGVMMKNAAQAMTSLNQAINGVMAVMEKMQQGQFNDRVTVEAKGDLHKLKAMINDSMNALDSAIQDITRITVAQSEGDLTQTISAQYQGQLAVLKEAINKSVVTLDEIVSVAVEAADSVSHAALEVAQGSMDLSDRVQRQAAAIEQSSATMEEFSAAVQNNAQNATEATQVEHQVEAKAKQAGEVMTQTIEAMSAIQESSHKISDIVTLIDGIAFQTNLLALNAAVEAARAGEHGRGFAVVAGEVRALAQKSAEAAKDIKTLINESVTRIDQGTKLAAESGEVIQEITTSIEHATQMSEQISQASSEQAEGVRQLQAAISQIDEGTQQNAALVEETSAAAESMREQSARLSERMAFFKTTGAKQSGRQPAKLSAPAPKLAAPKAAAKSAEVKKVAAAKPAPSKSANNGDEWAEF
jgi:methyl-accepting chemotaxis protein